MTLIQRALLFGLFVLLTTLAAVADDRPAPTANTASNGWKSLITPQQLHDKLSDPKLLIIDARAPAEYAVEHIPGAINLPGSKWRTPATKVPSKEGVGQKIFRRPDGQLDVARYEKLLGDAGVTADREIVVYGNYAGKADGSVPATILLKLGHKRVAFLDGVGIEQWKQAGYKTSTQTTKLSPAKYVAVAPAPDKLWSSKDVLANLGNKDVVFIDSRTEEEFAGADLRGNSRGGHLPGAKLLDEAKFLGGKNHETIPFDKAKAEIEAVIPRGKTVVIYCQSGTRCSHKELLLKDLGYDNVVLYDASWQEWGNLDNVPIEKPGEKAPSKPSGAKEPAKQNVK